MSEIKALVQDGTKFYDSKHFDSVEEGAQMNDVVVTIAAQQALQVLGFDRDTTFIESLVLDAIIRKDWNSRSLRKIKGELACDPDRHLCGVVNPPRHWVPFIVECVEDSCAEGSVHVTVIDSGLHPCRPYSGQHVYKLLASGEVEPDPNTRGMYKPDFLDDLLVMSVWYCTVRSFTAGTLIFIDVKGTGKQLTANRDVIDYADIWSCGRWTVVNLAILVSMLHGERVERLIPSAVVSDMQAITLQLVELFLCINSR